jgi:hypothetical protein
MSKSILYLFFIVFPVSVLFISCGGDSAPTETASDITVTISDSLIHHAYITDFYPTTNFKNDDDFAALSWIAVTTPYTGRTLFKFDLSSIPQNVTVTDAQLLLNYDQEPIHYTGAGHHQDSGSNACYFQRITQSWNDTTVTWNTQPSISPSGWLSIDSSTSNFQNYSIDLTSAVNDMVKNPSGNFGFLFRLKTELPLRVLGFSGGVRNVNLKPILRITYKPAQ